MPSFRYEAVDGAGRPQYGVVEAATGRAARDQLRGRGLFPTAIEEASAAGAGSGAAGSVRLSATLVALSTRQLATLVGSGLPLDQAFVALADQADDPRARKLFAAVRGDVVAGDTLAGALARWPRTFSNLYRSLVAVGAETGRLPEILARLADYLEARQALRQKFTVALIYPMLVTIIAAAVVVVLLTYVVPQVVAVYQQSRQTLPWLTRALIEVSAFFRATGVLWGAVAIGATVAVAFANRNQRFRAAWHRALLRLPVAGRLVTAIDAARFASTLAILVGSGAPLIRSLEASREVVWAIPLRDAAGAATVLVREGVAVARALKEQRVFPPVLVHLVANGEASGQLAPMLERAAAELEREAERRLTWFAALLQPALIVGMGGVVLVLVLAVMLPIVSMNQLIR